MRKGNTSTLDHCTFILLENMRMVFWYERFDTRQCLVALCSRLRILVWVYLRRPPGMSHSGLRCQGDCDGVVYLYSISFRCHVLLGLETRAYVSGERSAEQKKARQLASRGHCEQGDAFAPTWIPRPAWHHRALLRTRAAILYLGGVFKRTSMSFFFLG